MKILNRPMFRYGGPIKEGIMDGIQEPRQGYKVGSKVSLSEQAKSFENIFTTPQTTEQQATQFANPAYKRNFVQLDKPYMKKYRPDYSPKEFMGNQETDVNLDSPKMVKVDKYITNPNDIDGPRIINPKWEAGTGFQKNVTGVYEQEGSGPAFVETDINIEKAKIGLPENISQDMGSKNLPNVKDIIEKKDTVIDTEGNRKKSINNILEKLGYARSQKNALYDALIAGGQRISREGLGKTNLVNDLIADTSTAYDKPEKIREAAELMQVQQDLKLEGIDRSKDNRVPQQKLAEYYQSKDGGGYSKEVSIRMARNLPTTMSEYFSASKATSNQAKLYDATRAATKDGKLFGNVEYRGKIDKKKYENISDFLITSPDDGVYNILGRVVVIKDGEKITEVVVQPEVDSKGWFKKSE